MANPPPIKRIERTVINGKIVSEKIIEEYSSGSPSESKFRWGMNQRDYIDTLIKIFGLIGLILAVITFSCERIDKSKAEAKEIKKDAELALSAILEKERALKKNLRDSFLIEREYSRSMLLAQIEMLKNQNDLQFDLREYKQKDAQFNQAYVQQIDILSRELLESRKKDFASRQFQSHLEVVNMISNQISAIDENKFDASDEQSWNKIILTAQYIQNDSLSNDLYEFKNELIHFNVLDKARQELSAALNLAKAMKTRAAMPGVPNRNSETKPGGKDSRFMAQITVGPFAKFNDSLNTIVTDHHDLLLKLSGSFGINEARLLNSYQAVLDIRNELNTELKKEVDSYIIANYGLTKHRIPDSASLKIGLYSEGKLLDSIYLVRSFVDIGNRDYRWMMHQLEFYPFIRHNNTFVLLEKLEKLIERLLAEESFEVTEGKKIIRMRGKQIIENLNRVNYFTNNQ